MSDDSKRDQHVLPRRNGWAVKKEGSARAARVLPRKEQAVAFARNVASHDESNVIIHRLDGKVQAVMSGQRGSPKIPDGFALGKERVHVVPSGQGWAVRKQDRQQAAKTFNSRYGAIRYAHDMADRNGTAMVVHRSNGEIDHVDIPPHYKSPLSALMHAGKARMRKR